MEQKELFNKYSNIIHKSVSSKKEHHYLILLDDYIKLEKENEQLRLISGNQIRIKGELLKENQQLHNKIDKAIEYLEEDDNFWIPDSYSEDKVKMIQEELLKILKDSDVDV